ncbi:hypothetical protein BDN72DRAFT_832119 [Pluteus cervinus]|uniref:Uncharacterized protein n=1 Tax=Pluteus cervinus TaxID=181527 RepID=A0ACD3BCD6_9AGAR|nr:hypothetical protein BDN72DRAFT_832119 [Pluteus cervinus]
MPLPNTGNLALIPQQTSSDAKPKQAILMRMSTESLEALQEHLSDLKFDFGESPGFHIGKTFFPMRLNKEGNPHELYLRSLHPSVKVSNLKLHANVIGKFIADRELGEKSESKVRESTIRAAQEKSTPKTILTDHLPESAPTATTKKRKSQQSSMFRKPVRPSEQVRAPPVTPRQPSGPSGPSLRQRLVHCLALGSKSTQELLKLFEDLSGNRRALEEVAISNGDADQLSALWQLKSASWRDVRPYDWPGYVNAERVIALRSARTVLKKAGVPLDDPVWTHFRTKNSSSQEPSTSRSTETKLSSESSDLPGTLPKAKQGKAVESRPPRLPSNAARNDEPKSSASALAKSSLSGARKPGSGFKVAKTHSPTPVDPPGNSPSRKSRDPGQERDVPQAGPSKLASLVSSHDSPQVRTTPSLSQDPDRNKIRPAKGQNGQERSSLSKQDLPQIDDNAPRLKRKNQGSSGPGDPSSQDTQQKRRKLANDSSEASDRDGKRKAISTLPKKPESLPPKPKPIKRESPALALSSASNHKSQPTPPRMSSTPTLPGQNSTKAKRSRRDLSMYTSSSSDEDEPKRKGAVTLSSRSTSSQTPAPIGRGSSRSTDHASLRATYNATYMEYLTTMQQLVAQNHRIDVMLGKGDAADAVSDSEEESQLLELDRLTAEHQRLHNQLKSITHVFNSGSQDSALTDSA